MYVDYNRSKTQQPRSIIDLRGSIFVTGIHQSRGLEVLILFSFLGDHISCGRPWRHLCLDPFRKAAILFLLSRSR